LKEGLIRKEQGKGSFVERKDQRLGLLSFRGFSEVIGNTSHQASSRLLQPIKRKKWTENFFFDLNKSERNQGCIVIKRLREVDGLPVMLEHTYLPDILADFLEKKWENGSLFKTLQVHYQVQVRSVEQYIRAIVANDKLAESLKLEKDMPLLKINRKYATNKGGFFIYSTLYCNTKNYALGSFME
jgi:GntR family transcriptional regulator/GntR family frlABCD operon transcriptional regulator